MTSDDVKQQLSSIIVPSPIIDGEDSIQLDARQFISVNNFVSMFDGADLTVASLTQHPNCTDGWHAMFLTWQAQGFLS